MQKNNAGGKSRGIAAIIAVGAMMAGGTTTATTPVPMTPVVAIPVVAIPAVTTPVIATLGGSMISVPYVREAAN
jgi:hypothetical protein